MLHILQYNTEDKDPHINCKTQSYHETGGTFYTIVAHKTEPKISGKLEKLESNATRIHV